MNGYIHIDPFGTLLIDLATSGILLDASQFKEQDCNLNLVGFGNWFLSDFCFDAVMLILTEKMISASFLQTCDMSDFVITGSLNEIILLLLVVLIS